MLQQAQNSCQFVVTPLGTLFHRLCSLRLWVISLCTIELWLIRLAFIITASTSGWQFVPSLVLAQDCRAPVAYRLGEVDSRFNLTSAQARRFVVAAANTWNMTLGREVLIEGSGSAMPVHFKFGKAQALIQTANTLKKKGLSLDTDVTTFNNLQDSLNADIAAANRESASLNLEIESLSEQISEWNSQSLKPPEQYHALQKERSIVETRQKVLIRKQRELEEESRLMGKWRELLETQRSSHELEWDVLKAIQNESFEFQKAGVFRRRPVGDSISIFVFPDLISLKTLLMHEFGHALGIGHVPQDTALMYHQLQQKNKGLSSPSPVDIAAFERLCS